MKKVGSEKDSGTKQTNKAGFPPAYFLHALAPGMSGVRVLARATEKERAQFRGKPISEVCQHTYLGLVELSARVGNTFEWTKERTDEGLDTVLANPARELAYLGVTAANLLHDLAVSDSRWDVISAALRVSGWPVVLNRTAKQSEGAEAKPVFEGIQQAKDYLSSIRLGEDCRAVLRHLNDSHVSPFRKAAELLLHGLLEFRERHAWQYHPALEPGRSKLALWARKVLKLQAPMTTDNVDKWWSVAKFWMDDQWRTNRLLFEPLIKHLKLDKPAYVPSEVKRQVIDDSLKKAFKALATPPYL